MQKNTKVDYLSGLHKADELRAAATKLGLDLRQAPTIQDDADEHGKRRFRNWIRDQKSKAEINALNPNAPHRPNSTRRNPRHNPRHNPSQPPTQPAQHNALRWGVIGAIIMLAVIFVIWVAWNVASTPIVPTSTPMPTSSNPAVQTAMAQAKQKIADYEAQQTVAAINTALSVALGTPQATPTQQSAAPVQPTIMPVQPTAAPAQPTYTPLPTYTSIPVVQPTNVPVIPTAAPTSNWIVYPPPAPTWMFLPHDLSVDISYQEPPQNCAQANDVNQTCSTLRGQKTNGVATLKAGYALVMTGDNIALTSNETLLADRPDLGNPHDLWILLNSSNEDVKVGIDAPEGSFRGYFNMKYQNWDTYHLGHLRDLHLERFLQPDKPETYTPTPVPNCDSTKDACPSTNVRVLVYTGNGVWVKASYGVYTESIVWWVSK